MRLNDYIEQAMKGARSLAGAQKRLEQLLDDALQADEHSYYVRPYVVRGHLRRRRHQLKLIKRA